MRIGLIFGSFNPIHNGHIELGKRVLDMGLVDTVKFVIAKQNPFKPNYGVSFADRERMLGIAIMEPVMKGYNMHILGVEEFAENPRTYCTLETIKELHGYDNEYIIICGDDMYNQIPRWFNGQYILDNYKFIVFNRDEVSSENTDKVTYLSTDGLEMVSSSYIRDIVQKYRSGKLNGSITDKLDGIINQSVLSYILQFNLYWIV